MRDSDSSPQSARRTDEHPGSGIPGTPERGGVTSERNSERCGAGINVRFAMRLCEKPAGHDGYHVTNDACGRPEYFWSGPR